MILGTTTSSSTSEPKSFGNHLSRDDHHRIHHQAPHYLLIRDILYRRGVDTILHRCLTIDEADRVLNDCHSGTCGGHLSGMSTAQKIIRAGYFWPTLFHDCIHAVKRCDKCQLYANKARAPPALLHPVITAGPFCKWGIDFMTCNPPSSNGHKYIIVAVDYFTKWVEAMPTFNNTADTATHFFFNHVISRFGVPLQLVSDHGKHFENEIFVELSSRLGFSHEFASPYYPQSNGQVEAVNKVLKTMLQCTVNKHKTNWHHMLFSALWAYRTAVKMATGFTPFHLVHGVEATLPIECEIPTLRTTIELLPDTAPMEQHLLNLESLDEDRRSSLQNNEAAKKWSKATFDRHVNLRSFHEGDLILAYDIAHDTLGHGKFESLWHGPYIIQHCLTKGAYILASPEGLSLKEPVNGLYLKKFYA
jgi:hypothetical protein